MVDLYSTLLKDPEQVKFGVSASHIVFDKPPKGEALVSATKLLVNWNGDNYDPLECKSVSVTLEDGAIHLNVVLMDDKEHIADDVPQTDAVATPDLADKFKLQGDDLESFEMLSLFRKDENKGEKTETTILEAHTLESGTFNIQDLSSVQNSVLDIMAKEKVLIDAGCKVFQLNTPRFEYVTKNDFKLVEVVVLVRDSAIPVPPAAETGE